MNRKLKSNPFERSQPVDHDFFNVPLLGLVRAGHPDALTGDYDLGDLVTNHRRNRDDSITLQILDDAMEKAGILRGDFITVRLDTKPDNGDIALVKLGERYYVRTFFRMDQRIRLETAGVKPSTLIIENNTPGFEVIGKIQSLSRQF